MLDFSIYTNEDAAYNEFNFEDYDDILTKQKENLCKNLLENYSNLNMNYKVIDGQEFNEMLNECSMVELYTANPYDAFLQLCMLTDVPLATYDSVIEKSFEENNR